MNDQKKIKIAIVTHKMVMGGIEKSIISLCKVLLQKGAEITLYLEMEGGELLSSIPPEITIKYIFDGYSSTQEIFRKAIKHKKLSVALSAIKSRVINQLNSNPVFGWNAICDYLEKEICEYDYAFAYGAPIAFSTVFVQKKINAKKKYAWIHNDPTQLSLDIRKYEKLYEDFDRILCVSEKTKLAFLNLFPNLTHKTDVFYNIVETNEILLLSNEKIMEEQFDGYKLLTVGRLCDAKGQDIIPNILRRLVNDNFPIRWYCVGDGENKMILEKMISDMKLENNMFLLGNRINPYPYFRYADIYVQPSRSEAFCITLTEAKIFGLPIVTTDFDGASEQICNNETGSIVQFDENEIYYAIKELIEDKEKMIRYRNNLEIDKKKCVSEISCLL